MPISDAFVVGEDFLSEHYFNSDANNESFRKLVLERRKEWEQAKQDGLETSRSRFTAARGELAVQIAALYTDADDQGNVRPAQSVPAVTEVYERLLAVLGYRGAGLTTHVEGPVTWFNTPGVTEAAPLAVVMAMPAATVDDVFAKADEHPLHLTEPWQVDERTTETLATRAISRIFLADDAPSFVLLLAGRFALVTEQARWAEGRYLAVDLQAVCDRNDGKQAGEIERMLTCLEANSLAPDADGQVWWTGTLEDSVKHTVGVSKDLREGVRRSIEIIANEVVARRRAQGLPPLPASQAQPLARQSLRFLYRILFLLYAEASPELGVLPTGAPEYDAGYSLDRLRELTLTTLSSQKSKQGTHFYDSLEVLFRLVDQGHTTTPTAEPTVTAAEPVEAPDDQTLTFHPLRADLFLPQSIALISETKLGNEALQQVLQKLLLSAETRGRDRGFISYVDLGINQLGAVYEGLMSYTGFFAETDLYEVARDGNPEKGSWVVPVERAQGIDAKDFVKRKDVATGEEQPVIHKQGQFVYRLSGRARQQSASYYTPEVLTKFTVGQALEELLDQDGVTTPAEDILGMSICEPALGSGAFAIEATRQLAEQYLKRRQDELGERIAPEDYPRELQRVKAYIALHNVHGVDLNATAVEFAEITLWLDTMAEGLQAPWFGLHLRRGNSLIGARRELYSADDVKTKAWLGKQGKSLPLTDLAERITTDATGPTAAYGKIHHFLLPAEGWGATADSKEAKALAPERVVAVKDWRKKLKTKPTPAQIKTLQAIAVQVEELWTMALRRLTVAEQQSRRDIPVWGMDRGSLSSSKGIEGTIPKPVQSTIPEPVEGSPAHPTATPEHPTPIPEPVEGHVSREQIEESLADPNGAFQRLKRIMDAWCALWFWPLTGDEITPPTLAGWLSACQMILGAAVTEKSSRKHFQDDQVLSPADEWAHLAEQERFVLAGANAKSVEAALELHPWLRVCQRIADEQGFFHWPLHFAPVFGRGGFDLQVGNPPWVRPDSDVDALLAEGDPWWQLSDKPPETAKKARKEATLAIEGMPGLVASSDSETVALRAYVGARTNYPELDGLRPDLYRCFMAATWAHNSPHGMIGLLHPDSHFTEEKAGTLRTATYSRLRRHWQFGNDLKLFDDIDNHVAYGTNVYGGNRREPCFLQASNLYHPDTVTGSRRHNGEGEAPGFKFEGHWDQRPHKERIEEVTDKVLSGWRDILDPGLRDPRRTRMLYTVNREVAEALQQLSNGPRLATLGLAFSAGWNETTDRQKGYFTQQWGEPASWDEVILQGPHLFVGTPMYKTPRASMKSNKDWAETDFETLAPDAIPVTAYKPAGDPAKYDRDYTHWPSPEPDGAPIPARSQYRLAWRKMAANTGERTLISAIIPPSAAHIDGVVTASASTLKDLVRASAACSSLLADFNVRAAPMANLRTSVLERMPLIGGPLLAATLLRCLRLNCMTHAYADLWREVYDPAFATDSWTSSEHVFCELGAVGPEWTPDTALRRAADRRQALVEIDALVALMLGVTADQLCTVYRTQFAVLYGYDHDKYTFDANGRIVPNPVLVTWRKKGDRTTEEERTHTNEAGNTYVYELPFQPYDREHDMRVAYTEFERRLVGMSGESR
ncbi:class I SAM-dependent DNA methyltransferase [Luteococcus sp. Sow4_B9]|uniref:class I SAM-dependent DNA methyltransferase n=1 Tax=Luteococcus sp. Sow4_B9 TaxID=3438792 RepID=UPI003F9595FA